MPLARRLSTLRFVLSAVGTLHVATQRTVSLSTDDQRCFFSTLPAKTCTPLRACHTCLNSALATTPCFLDSRGLCLAMTSYDPTPSAGVQQFAAANTTYCPLFDATCRRCLADAPSNGVCTGDDGACVCLAACEAATWADDVKAIVSLSSASTVGSPSVVSASTTDEPHTSSAVVFAAIVACVVVVALLANTIRRRWRAKQASTAYAYNVAVTPSADLPPKPLAGRV